MLRELLKRVAYKILPENAITGLKKIYFSRRLKSVSDNSEPDFIIIKQLVNQGDCVVDMGANVGAYTYFLSQHVGPSGQVYSIEPIPVTYEILEANIRNLKLENVKPFNCALSNDSGPAKMQIPVYSTGDKNYYEASLVTDRESTSHGLQQVDVMMRTADSILSGSENNIRFIKCDVEGHELSCIMSAMETVKRFHPAWMVEISGNPDSPEANAYKLFEAMRQERYDIYWFDGQTLHIRRDDDKSLNYFFLTKDHITHLQNKNVPMDIE